ncbi:MAG TPA: OB-fold domain-containing protein [Acidimicrobiales bacterium]|jgi:uncharacterized OB-fold protein|nr:OB-fold domain-containing protein [Acidimicrobiales bacterium]HMS86864.1 OB-fold domain-containing protein [Acidimicrobiales bacterium]HRA34608.1 OB-fold domain-containing protein [Acidimicrobiales bacterium]
MERIAPPSTDLTDPFWDATREHRYLVQWCTACDQPIFYPRVVCPTCLLDEALEWRPSTGAGVVYAASVQHRPAYPGLADQVPYVVVLVDLDAGGGDDRTVRVMSNVVECDPSTVRADDVVVLAWEPLPDGRNLPVFRLDP